MTSNFFSPLSFVAVFGSGMGENQDPGSGIINIPDPQHWLQKGKYWSGQWQVTDWPPDDSQLTGHSRGCLRVGRVGAITDPENVGIPEQSISRIYRCADQKSLKEWCGSMAFWYGSGPAPLIYGSESGSGSCFFRQWPSRHHKKEFFLSKFLRLFLFEVKMSRIHNCQK